MSTSSFEWVPCLPMIRGLEAYVLSLNASQLSYHGVSEPFLICICIYFCSINAVNVGDVLLSALKIAHLTAFSIASASCGRFASEAPSHFVLLASVFSLLCSYVSFSASHVQSSLTCMWCRIAFVYTLCFPCSVCPPIPLFSSADVSCAVSCNTSLELVRACEARSRTWVWSWRSAALSKLRIFCALHILR